MTAKTLAERVAQDGARGIDIGDVRSAYRGKAGACCCGCKGEHSEDDEMKRRVLAAVQAYDGEVEDLDHAWAEFAGKLYIVYLRD